MLIERTRLIVSLSKADYRQLVTQDFPCSIDVAKSNEDPIPVKMEPSHSVIVEQRVNGGTGEKNIILIIILITENDS